MEIVPFWKTNVGGGEMASFVVFTDGRCLVLAFGSAVIYDTVDDYWSDDLDFDNLPLIEESDPPEGFVG